MLVSATVHECDFTNREYPEGADGGWYIAQGASGRYCVVMYAGPDYIAETNAECITYDQALARIEEESKLKGSHIWADF